MIRATRSCAKAALLACVAAACGRATEPASAPTAPPGTLPFKAIRMVSVTPEEGAVEPACPVDAGLLFAVAAGGLDVGTERPALRLAVACAEGDAADRVVVRVAAELEVSPPGEPEALYEGLAERACDRCSEGGWRLLLAVAGAIRAGIEGAAASARLAGAPDDEVLRILRGPDPTADAVLLTAIDLAGDRRLAGAVAPLVALLQSRDRDLVLRAMGSLGRIGDTAAIRALGKVALSPAPDLPHVALRAIGDIGGPEARRVLEMIGNQTTDPVVAREAADLIREVDGGRDE
ncbi:MAG: HEAT repeat domain-containing protein [Deltaproteobacteria bacterium]|nr:HEAT repeat domain-containing protein [Deltaproteobacteria bacterium]